MNVPLVLPPEEIERRQAQEEARAQAAAEANAYLASRGVAGFTPVSAPMSSMPAEGGMTPAPPPAGPPPPPPPPPRRDIGAGLRAAGQGVATVLGGPVAGALAGAAMYDTGEAPPPKPPPEAPPGSPDVPAPPPEESGDESPIFDPRVASRPGVVVPAGMYPHSMTTSKKLGKDVPDETRRALGAATGLELDAAQKDRDAAQEYYRNIRGMHEAQLRATSDAAASHANVQAKRDAEVNRRIAEIETLNKQAQGSPEDMWSDGRALAGLIGTIASTIGVMGGATGNYALGTIGIMTGRMVNNFINQDIADKMEKRKAAGQAADRTTNLLGLYLEKFGQEDKAIDATKLAYFDNVLAQMEMYKANHAGQVSEAKYQQMQAGILKDRAEVLNKLHAQETDDVAQQYSEQWRPMQVLGGGRVGGDAFAKDHEPGHTVVLPPSDATGGKSVRIGVKEQEAALRLQKEASFVGRLSDINNRAIELRKQVGDAIKSPSWQSAQKAANARAELMKLEQEKSKLISSKDAQGVLKEAEYFRTMDLEVGLSNIDVLKDTPKLLRRENDHMTKGLQQSVKAAGGSVVKQGFVRDKHGALKKVQMETGSFYEPESLPPEEAWSGEVK